MVNRNFEDELRKDLPRGVEGGEDSASDAQWMPKSELRDWSYRRKKDDKADGIFLGYRDGRDIGYTDDRHVLTVAGSRAGKGASLIVPNLRLYDGSALCIDPKGELARLTYRHREEKGQCCYALDPFGVAAKGDGTHRIRCARWNPFDEIDPDSENAVDDATSLAEALVITPDNTSEPYWTESARELVRALILYILTMPPKMRELLALRQLITLSGPEFDQTDDAKQRRGKLFQMMKACRQFPVVYRTGSAFEAIEDKEISGVFSSARSQTQFLDSPNMQKVLSAGTFPEFMLRDLKERKTTVYLCLPAGRMGEFARWLRLIINLAMVSFERDGDKPDIPVLVVMDEFPVLGHMKSIEVAAGQIAGFGVKLWTVLQDLTQIKRLYRDSWETFIGNAGVSTYFGNVDLFTTEFVSKKLGKRMMLINEPSGITFSQQLGGASPYRQTMKEEALLSPPEVERILGRKKKRVLVFASGERPVILERAIYYDKNDPLFGPEIIRKAEVSSAALSPSDSAIGKTP